MNQWKPIETAPKDGIEVILCRAVNDDGKPITDEAWGIFVQVAAWWSEAEKWIVYCSLPTEPELHFEPTHWMPLPDNPLIEKAAHVVSPKTDLLTEIKGLITQMDKKLEQLEE